MSTLTDRLAAVLESYGLRQSPSNSEQVQRPFERLRPDDSVGRPLQAGQKAPSFTLTDQRGNVVRSADILARGPLIVSFFRGPWCPYCNAELAALTDAYPKIRETGAEVVAVTPQERANARDFRDEHQVPFPILVDVDFSVESSFGVTDNVPKYLRTLGNPWRPTVLARFVIAMNGTIVEARATHDYHAGQGAETALTSLEAVSCSVVQEHTQGDEDERQRRFGDFLRRHRLAIPVEAKALGSFVRLPNRLGKAVSQEEFAEAIGVSRSWYGLLETGRPVQPSAALLDRICDALMVYERQRLTLFELGLPAFARRAVELGRRAVIETSARNWRELKGELVG